MTEPQRKPFLPVWLWAAGVGLLALVLRIGYVWQVRGSSLVAPEELDPGFYYNWARAIAGGNWLGTTSFVQSPLYAYLLGLFMKIFGTEVTPILVAQSLVGVGTVLLAIRAGQRYFDTTRGLLAGLLLALYGPFIFFEGMVMKTFLSPFLTLILALALERARRLSVPQGPAPDPAIDTAAERPTGAAAPAAGLAAGVAAAPTAGLAAGPATGAFVLAGIVFGLLCLDRDNFVLLAPVLAVLAIVLAGGPRRGGVKAAVALAIGAAVVIVPVTVRNWAVSRELVLLTTGGGEVFFIGNNADANGLYTPPPFVRPDPLYEHADFVARAAEITGHAVTPMESSWFWFREGAKYILDEPLGWVRLLWLKFLHFWNWYELPDNLDYEVLQRFAPLLDRLNAIFPPHGWPTLALPAGGGIWLPARLHLWLTFGTLAPLGLFGIVLSRRRWRTLLPLYVLLFGYAGTVMLFFNFSRFRVPAVPILALFAAEGVLGVGRGLRRAWDLGIAVAGRSGDMAARARSVFGGRGGVWAAACLLVALVFVNLELPRGVLPAIEQALVIGNAFYAQGDAEKAQQSYYQGLVLLAEGPAGAAGDELLRRQFGPGVTRETLAKEIEVESVARGQQFKGIHLGIHHGLGIAMVLQAQLLLDQGKRIEAMPLLDRAIEQFNEALKIAPSYLLTHRKLARAYQLRGDTPQAVEWLRKAVDLWPEDLQARLDLSEVLYSTGEFQDALRQLEAARHYNPDMPTPQLAQVWFNRGLVYLRGLDEDGRALFDMEKAIEVDPQHPQAAAIQAAIRDLRARGVQPVPDEAMIRPVAPPESRPAAPTPAPSAPRE